jgi:hypothetical protein
VADRKEGEKQQLFTDLVVVGRGRRRFSLVGMGVTAAKIFLGCIFLPVFIFSNILENRNFLRLLKIAVLLVYTVFIGLCLYTFATRNRVLKNNEKIVLELDYRNRIGDFK